MAERLPTKGLRPLSITKYRGLLLSVKKAHITAINYFSQNFKVLEKFPFAKILIILLIDFWLGHVGVLLDKILISPFSCSNLLQLLFEAPLLTSSCRPVDSCWP